MSVLRARPLAALSLFGALMAVSPPAPAEEINVGNYGTGPNGFPWAVAMEEGLFKKHGVDVTGIRGASGGQAVRQVVAGDLVFGDGSLNEAITAISSGADLKVVSEALDNNVTTFWAVMPDSPIKDIKKDLKGRKWGMSSAGSITQAMGVYIINKLGYGKDEVPMVAEGTFAAGLTLLEHGGVDVAVIPEPLWSQSDGPKKYRAIVDGGSGILPAFNSGVGYATGKAMREKPEVLRGILAAHQDAIRFMKANPKKASEDVARQYKVDVAVIEPLMTQTLGPKGTVDGVPSFGEGGFRMKALEGSVMFSKMVGTIQGDVDWSKVLDTSFLPPDQQKIEP